MKTWKCFSVVHQLLPVLGSDILTPVVTPKPPEDKTPLLYCDIKGLRAKGERTPNGFVVFQGSQAVLETRPSAAMYPYTVKLREQLIQEEILQRDTQAYVFTKDIEFSSPSAAAAVIHGGSANGMVAWRTGNGVTLRQLESP